MSRQLSLEHYEAVQKASKKVEETGASIREERIEAWLRELADDMCVYDPRNWREQGITPEEVRLRYENPKKNTMALFDDNFGEKMEHGYFPNVSASRALGWIFPRLKDNGVPTERVVELIMHNKKRQLRRFRGYGLRELNGFYKRCVEGELKVENMERFQIWVEHAQHFYEFHVLRTCEELGIPSDAKPQWLIEAEAVLERIARTKEKTRTLLAQIHVGGTIGTNNNPAESA